MINNKLSWLEIDSQAFHHNINQIKTLIDTTQLGLVVKSNAYGHGIEPIVKLANQNSSIKWLCTASLSEALLVKQYTSTQKILVLSYLDEDVELALVNSIHCVVYNKETAQTINKVASKLNIKAYIHIKVDTGMSRLGVLYNQAYELIKLIRSLSHVIIYGIFTHLADPINYDQKFTILQLKRFESLLEILKKNNISIPCPHALSSSGLNYIGNYNYGLTRVGAFAYGLWKSEEHKQLMLLKYPSFNLKPLLTWKTQIIDIKMLPSQTSIGYNCSYVTKRPTKLGVIPIGYADGLNRKLSNKGSVNVKGIRAPLLGIISMNLTAIDLTDVETVKIYDEVTVLSDQTGPTSLEYSQQSETITNEVTTHIPATLKRFII